MADSGGCLSDLYLKLLVFQDAATQFTATSHVSAGTSHLALSFLSFALFALSLFYSLG